MNEVLSYSQARTDLSTYNNDWYNPGASALKRMLWYLVNVSLFINPLNPFSSLKVILLRLFGARVGKGVTLKPNINIKYPWLLEIGDHVWIGEGVWIDNLAPVSIGNHVCISQGALLLTGNHNYKKKTFDLMVGKITLTDGAWIGAKSVVCAGVTCGSHSVLSVGSVAVKDLKPYFIYQGNPAVPVRERTIE
jgi:putative colanic acid biosynthesis acetyltransferase WcaF